MQKIPVRPGACRRLSCFYQAGPAVQLCWWQQSCDLASDEAAEAQPSIISIKETDRIKTDLARCTLLLGDDPDGTVSLVRTASPRTGRRPSAMRRSADHP